MANSKQQPALLPTPAHARLLTTTCSKQQPPVSSPTLYHYTSPAYHGTVTKEPYHILIYLPVIILTLTDIFTSLMCQQHYQNTSHHKQYVHKGTQSDIIMPL